MLTRCLDNKFLNAAIFYIMSAALVSMLPLLLFLKIMYSIFRRCAEDQTTHMRGKVVLITGASSGIGEYMAYEYARKKAFLAIVARREDKLKQVAEKAQELGSPDVITICGDVSKFDDCRRFIEETVDHFGRLDHLVNNAGVASIYLVNEGDDVTKYTSTMDINFWGSVYPTHFAIPHLKKTRGRIIVNSSAAAYISLPTLSFYSASKAALVSFYESLRAELAPEITITIATLGFVKSEITTLGKVMNAECELQQQNQALRNAIHDGYPVMSTEPCAKKIVDGACRGDEYITEPQVYRMLILLQQFFPEISQWHTKRYFAAKLHAG